MRKRTLQKFVITSFSAPEPFQVGDVITIAGMFVPTWYERLWCKIWRPLRLRFWLCVWRVANWAGRDGVA